MNKGITMRYLVILSLSTIAACSSSSPKKIENTGTCLAAREYITTMEFIRAQKDFALNEKQARDLSNQISKGCTGASRRFIQVTNLLVKSGLPSQKAIETGVKYALGDEDSYAAFMTIFKSAYLESLLDLDLKLSLDISTELSHVFKGNKKAAQEEFNNLVDFCVSKKSLDLPLRECAKTAARVVKSAENFNFKISRDFINLFNFVTDKNGANQPTFKALSVAENVVQYGPEAKGSFLQAYEYGISKKGLELPTNDAIEFGKTMASRSVTKDDTKN
jgi:hypothetical protein